MQTVLFICSQNRLRSPTAEQVFANYPGVETRSAGISNDADNPVTPEDLLWARLVFVMEKVHQKKLTTKFSAYLKTAKIICLNIPDEYALMDPELVDLLEKKVPPFLR